MVFSHLIAFDLNANQGNYCKSFIFIVILLSLGLGSFQAVTRPAFICLMPTTETPEQHVMYVQS